MVNLFLIMCEILQISTSILCLNSVYELIKKPNFWIRITAIILTLLLRLGVGKLHRSMFENTRCNNKRGNKNIGQMYALHVHEGSLILRRLFEQISSQYCFNNQCITLINLNYFHLHFIYCIILENNITFLDKIMNCL